MTLKNPFHDHWNKPESHVSCLDGACGHCHGKGEVECECPCCGDEHLSDCEHCDGTGKCEYDGLIVRSAVDEAEQRLAELRDEAAYELSKDGFKRAFQQMFGRDAPDDMVAAWHKSIAEMEHMAGLRQSIKQHDKEAGEAV